MIVEIKRSTEGIVLNVAESLDASVLPEAEEAMTTILEHHRESVVLNLYECEYLDETAVYRLADFGVALREQGRGFSVYVRPMSFVAFRTQNLPQNVVVPPNISKSGEENLAARRSQRLERWRMEKPIPQIPLPSAPTAELLGSLASKKERSGAGPLEPGERDDFDIDLKRVSALAGTDERVIERIWATYTKFLNEGKFPVAPDGSADAQMTLDSNLVAKSLRLNPKTVRRVVEAVSTHLMEVFGTEKG